MKSVLAFGDSLTWGECPRTGGRHSRTDRWPNALAAGLDNVEVISEGLRGRTTVYDRPTGAVELRGDKALPILLHSHMPLDLVVIMLGLNEVYEGRPNYLIKDGLMRLVELIRFHPWRIPGCDTPKILMVAPPPATECAGANVTAAMQEQTEDLAGIVKQAAEQAGCAFFDGGTVARASALDGFHLEAADSHALGVALQEPVAALLNS